jgi:hypothetical protein
MTGAFGAGGAAGAVTGVAKWSKEPRRISVVEGREAASLARASGISSFFILINETTESRLCQSLARVASSANRAAGQYSVSGAGGDAKRLLGTHRELRSVRRPFVQRVGSKGSRDAGLATDIAEDFNLSGRGKSRPFSLRSVGPRPAASRVFPAGGAGYRPVSIRRPHQAAGRGGRDPAFGILLSRSLRRRDVGSIVP